MSVVQAASAIRTAADEGNLQVLTFLIGEEEYGVDILRVQEIRGWDSATPIPNTGASLRGVINLRGTIVPIIDLRLRLGMPERAYGPTTVVIVMRVVSPTRDRTMGIVVDAVSDVHVIGRDQMRPPVGIQTSEFDFVEGLATVDDKMLIVVDVDQLLNSGELAERPSDG